MNKLVTDYTGIEPRIHTHTTHTSHPIHTHTQHNPCTHIHPHTFTHTHSHTTHPPTPHIPLCSTCSVPLYCSNIGLGWHSTKPFSTLHMYNVE